MTDKQLRSLSRIQLLEILIKLSEENEELKKQIEELTQRLEKREIAVERAGSIAEASLSLNGVFDAAEKAAEQYLDNIKRLNEEAASLRTKAEDDARKIIEEARKTARLINEKAQKKSKGKTGKGSAEEQS